MGRKRNIKNSKQKRTNRKMLSCGSIGTTPGKRKKDDTANGINTFLGQKQLKGGDRDKLGSERNNAKQTGRRWSGNGDRNRRIYGCFYVCGLE